METIVDMHEVIPGLYIGAEKATREVSDLKTRGITHILTVNQYPLPLEISKHFTCKFVQGLDLEFTDLLCYFEECFDFIEKGISSGGVLVHCLMGCSRSATVVIAYLMYKNQRGFGETLGLVRRKRSCVYPNEGFTSQLLLFERMGCRIDKQHDLYRKYKLEKLALRMQNASPFSIESDSKQTFSLEDLRENPSESVSANDIIYKCRKCRQALFKKSGVMTHQIGAGDVAFDWRGKCATNQLEADHPAEVCERSLFIEPVKWMADFIHVPEGKLTCPKCNSKIGSFIWYGERCPCGTWIAPAFHIQTAKVDECRPRALPGQKLS